MRFKRGALDGGYSMKLHQRGVDLLLNLQDALDHIDRLETQELHQLIKEAEIVLQGLLARDQPHADEPKFTSGR